MKRKLIWLTHSFRLDSRLTNSLSGPCTFVYYSPYYFAGPREKQILNECSQQNLDAFYQSLDFFRNQLSDKGHQLHIFKESDPIAHINSLVDKYGFEKVIIDLPLFGMWNTTDPMEIKVPFTLIDSDLIDDECRNMTAKHRWMSHTRKIHEEKDYKWQPDIHPIAIDEHSESYPEYQYNELLDSHKAFVRAFEISPTYGQTRDKHDGQTRLSTAFQNGTLDPHNTFYQIARQFSINGADFSKNEGAHAAMLRQFAFREMTIIRTRQSGLTMEAGVMSWARIFLTEKSYDNLITRANPESNLTFDQIKEANTGDPLVDQILEESYQVGVMPNRARMFFAGWMFYNAPTGKLALHWLIDVFNNLLLDGQCPTNYTQCCSSMNLQYGKVMLLNRNNVKNLLSYETETALN